MMSRGIAKAEAAKYRKVWGLEAYHENSPGAVHADLFMGITKAKPGHRVIDVGAGAGAGSVALSERGLNVTAFDLTDEAWAHENITLHTGTIWRDLGKYTHPPFDFAYCCDVMEHIPTQFVGLCLSSILNSCGGAFFSISFNQDVMGEMIGEPLHLTVQPFTWWRDTFRELGTLYEARDMLGEGIFYAGR